MKNHRLNLGLLKIGVLSCVMSTAYFLLIGCDEKEVKEKGSDGVSTQIQTATGTGGTKEQADGTKGETGSGAASEATVKGFLKESDFKIEKGTITAARLKSILSSDLVSLVSHQDAVNLELSNDLDSDSECVEKRTELIKVNPKSISIEADGWSCKLEKDTKMTMKIKSILNCGSKAFEKLKSADVFSKPILALCNDQVEIFENSKITVKSDEYELDEMQATMTSKSEPCTMSVKKTKVTFDEGCRVFKSNKHKFEEQEKKVSILATYKSVSGGLNEKYYSKGSLEVSINTWKGSIKFGKGDPAFTFTSSKGEKVSGTWDELREDKASDDDKDEIQ